MTKQLNVPCIEYDKLISKTEFVDTVESFNQVTRDNYAIDLLSLGHMPEFMRSFVDVKYTFLDVDKNQHEVTLHVLPDYLTIGSDLDNFRIPLSPLAAQQLCNKWDCMLPTTKISDIIWQQAIIQLDPKPFGPPYDASMMSMNRIVLHDLIVNEQIAENQFFIDNFDKLTAGHKKDVVMTQRLIKQPKQVAIYGWHKLNGVVIQPLYLGHDNFYADYSHGIRMVSLDCEFDGSQVRLNDLLADSKLYVGFTNEKTPQTIFRQPNI